MDTHIYLVECWRFVVQAYHTGTRDTCDASWRGHVLRTRSPCKYKQFDASNINSRFEYKQDHAQLKTFFTLKVYVVWNNLHNLHSSLEQPRRKAGHSSYSRIKTSPFALWVIIFTYRIFYILLSEIFLKTWKVGFPQIFAKSFQRKKKSKEQKYTISRGK